MRQKKRQERIEEGQPFGSMSQLMEMIASMQASTNSRFDALDGKILNIQERVMRSLKGNLQRSKRSLKTRTLYEDEVIKLKTLKTRRMVRDSFINSLEETSLEKLSLKKLSALDKAAFYRKTGCSKI
ncbi:hypothetical protein M9H77_21006 [Catharanthus roseus]|uniref:Uncharacterized protein n=1 Tax=Catharanthus roseus TaxID=4058 RepID=A0ACC0AP22_CATRO|nr:hypothetical protein M9H77_21006 [Catharanthus roseus]